MAMINKIALPLSTGFLLLHLFTNTHMVKPNTVTPKAVLIQKNDPGIGFIDLAGRNTFYWYASNSNYGSTPFTSFYRILQGEFTNSKYGWARIVCYPKSQKQLTILDSLNILNAKKHNELWIKNYIVKHLLNFDIWAVFVDKTYDKVEPDAGDSYQYIPECPCKASLYKWVNNSWKFFETAPIPGKVKNAFALFPKPPAFN